MTVLKAKKGTCYHFMTAVLFSEVLSQKNNTNL